MVFRKVSQLMKGGYGDVKGDGAPLISIIS